APRRRVRARGPASNATTSRGAETNAAATAAPAVVNGTDTPTCASRRPRNLNRPSTARRATPATTGGSTTGSTITARTSRRAGRATRASAHAAGNPTTSDRRVDPMVTFSETTSAVH